MLTLGRSERIDAPTSVTGPTRLRPAQSAPVRRESLPKQAAHDGNEGVTPAWRDDVWNQPFAD